MAATTMTEDKQRWCDAAAICGGDDEMEWWHNRAVAVRDGTRRDHRPNSHGALFY